MPRTFCRHIKPVSYLFGYKCRFSCYDELSEYIDRINLWVWPTSHISYNWRGSYQIYHDNPNARTKS